jgi:type III pantothenate kinase
MAATAVAAVAYYGCPVIVVDMGTATKISVISQDGNIIGGAICPGLGISADALFREASLLPRVSIDVPGKAISANTIDCIKSGLVFGAAAMVDGMVQRFIGELGMKPSVVATGGLAARVIPHCITPIPLHDNLLLDGLCLLYEKNTLKPRG